MLIRLSHPYKKPVLGVIKSDAFMQQFLVVKKAILIIVLL